MFDKLIDVIISFLDKLTPFVILKQYEEGVFMRLGIYRKSVGPGLHWKIPIADEIDAYPVVTTTIPLHAQSIVTRDEVEIVVKAQTKYKISDIKKYALDTYDATNALSDISAGVIYEITSSLTYKECINCDLNALITKQVQKQAKFWGFEVIQVKITDFSKMRSIRLFNETLTHPE